MPEPTVTVRMEEDAQTVAIAASIGSASFAVSTVAACVPFAIALKRFSLPFSREERFTCFSLFLLLFLFPRHPPNFRFSI
ncbi:MAG: hypothetical protein ACTHKH_03425 [Trinickia sp.]